METESTGELPHALHGIQFRTVRRQEVQSETLGSFLPPVLVQPGMVVFRVVGNHHYPSRCTGADRAQIFQELPAGNGVELAGLTLKERTYQLVEILPEFFLDLSLRLHQHACSYGNRTGRVSLTSEYVE